MGPGPPPHAEGKGTAGTGATPGGPISPQLSGRAGWARAGESPVPVRAGRDHGAGPVGGSVGTREWGQAAQRTAGSSRSPGARLTAPERRWLLGGRWPLAGRCGAEPRFPNSPPVLDAPTSGLPRAPALPGARGWSRGSWREPRARRGRARGPLPLPQVPSGALRAASASRYPPPARPRAPRRWARLAEGKVKRP